MRTRRLDAVPVYLIYSGGGALFSQLVFAVNLVYQVQVAHLNPLQLVLVGTVLEVTAFLFEIPTGVVADVYSRRLSLIIGCFLLGIGLALQGVVPEFGVILIAQVIWGIGYTFTSGAEQAWITDAVGEGRAAGLFLRAAQLGTVAALVATVMATIIGNFNLQLPILIGGGAYLLLGLFLIVAMPERGFIPTPRAERETWRAMGDTFGAGLALVRRSPTLVTILGIVAISGAATETFDRLSTDHPLRGFAFPDAGGLQPVAFLGAASVAGRLLNLGAMEVVRRRQNLASHRAVARTLTAITALLVVGYVAFALSGNLAFALLASTVVRLCRTVASPLTAAWLNQHVESRVRATVFSMSGQADALGQIAGGPVFGVVGLSSARLALALGGAVLSPALLLYARTLRRDGAVPVVVGEAEA